MKKENRLSKNHDFQKIIKKRKHFVSKYIVIYYLPSSQRNLRVGISISKKFINAVGRNKLRRQVRSILDTINEFEKPYDIVIMIRKPFIKANFQIKTSSLKNILKNIG